jgi:myo-inositol-1(or 4)-monophosphatase
VLITMGTLQRASGRGLGEGTMGFMADLDTLLRLHPLAAHAYQAGLTAGDFLLNGRPDNLQVDAKSSPTDAVTHMDQEAERMLLQALLTDRPGDGMVGEEGTNRPSSSGVTWIVDPLDGTVNYLYRIPMWGVSIAAEVDGVLELGVVIVPAFDESFIGIRGEGAWHIRGGLVHRIAAPSDPDLAHCLVATGFGYAAEQRSRQARILQNLLPQVRDIRRMGACVVDLCWLALGRIDAYYEMGLHQWDYSAGVVIAREAGHQVTGLLEDEPSSTFLVAGRPNVHRQLRSVLRDSI